MNLRDDVGREQIAFKLLSEGDIFGEICTLFKCKKRSATIISRNYNTMAVLVSLNFKGILQQHANFEECLLKHIYRYNYPYKSYIWKIFQTIPCL